MEIKRALIVEDNKTFRSIMRVALAALGVKDVEEAEEGRAALEIIRDGGADLVLMDWMMEGIDGLDCARRIRGGAVENGDAIPIVMISGSADGDLQTQALLSGVDVCLSKPISLARLTAGVARAVDMRRAAIGDESGFMLPTPTGV